MAVPATLGQATPAASGASLSHTTTSGPITGKVWSQVGWFGAQTLSSVTYAGSSTGVTIIGTVSNGSVKTAIAHVDASGLASGATVQANFSASAGSLFLQTAFSTDYSGAHLATNSGTTGTTAWTSGSITVNSGETSFGGCRGDGNSATNTASGGNTEIHDQNIAADSAQTTQYQLGPVTAASQGTWTASLTNAATTASFGSGAAPVSPAPHPRRMPLGV